MEESGGGVAARPGPGEEGADAGPDGALEGVERRAVQGRDPSALPEQLRLPAQPPYLAPPAAETLTRRSAPVSVTVESRRPTGRGEDMSTSRKLVPGFSCLLVSCLVTLSPGHQATLSSADW